MQATDFTQYLEEAFHELRPGVEALDAEKEKMMRQMVVGVSDTALRINQNYYLNR